MESATATDNCGEVVITIDTNWRLCWQLMITRTFTATDDCGNATAVLRRLTTRSRVTSFFDYTAECSDEHPTESYII